MITSAVTNTIYIFKDALMFVLKPFVFWIMNIEDHSDLDVGFALTPAQLSNFLIRAIVEVALNRLIDFEYQHRYCQLG